MGVALCVSCEQGGWTPLGLACYHGKRDVALRLLRLGADPAIQDNDVSPICAPLRHQRCVCGVRGVLGHVCGGRVSGRVGPSGDGGPGDRVSATYLSKMTFPNLLPLF